MICAKCGKEFSGTPYVEMFRFRANRDVYCSAECILSDLICQACDTRGTASEPLVELSRMADYNTVAIKASCDKPVCISAHGHAKCNECGTIRDKDHMRFIQGEHYCSDICWETFAKKNDIGVERCDRCNRPLGNRNIETDGKNFCSYDCAHEAGYRQCSQCGDWDGKDKFRTILTNTISRETIRMCYSCQDKNDIYECNICGEYHLGGKRCPYIIRGITYYTYKPRPVFRRIAKEAPLYAGIEVELDHRHYTEEDGFCQDTASQLAEDTDGWLYSKHDTSAGAFEIVSHPFTFEWYKKNLDKFKIITNLSDSGYRSFHARDAGVHVHLSKDQFTTMQLYKFLSFIYSPRNTDFILFISQRERSKLNEWANPRHKDYNNIKFEAKNKHSRLDRHTAVALSEYTVELRIFRGTLNPKWLHKNIEFAFALHAFSGNTSHRRMTIENFMAYVAKFRFHYPNLHAFMAHANVEEMELDVDDLPKIAKRERVVSNPDSGVWVSTQGNGDFSITQEQFDEMVNSISWSGRTI